MEGDEDRGTEEESDLSEEQGKPDAEEGTGLEVEGIDDVGDHEAQGESGDHRRAAQVEEEGGAGSESDGDPGVVSERRRSEARILERSRGGGGSTGVVVVVLAV